MMSLAWMGEAANATHATHWTYSMFTRNSKTIKTIGCLLFGLCDWQSIGSNLEGEDVQNNLKSCCQ